MNVHRPAGSEEPVKRRRIAFVVSHPIQYYAPIYQRLAERDDLDLRVFFTWHAGEQATLDRGFDRSFAWDIPLTEGYDFEAVANVAADPGTHRFFGLRNPDLVRRVRDWKPDVVHLTGWAWSSHLHALRLLRRARIPVLFRGDSHLLDPQPTGLKGWVKRALLRRVFSWCKVCLYVGRANRDYYESFGVPATRLFYCPHSIDVERFAADDQEKEQEARSWRRQLGLDPSCAVLLFAGKFEAKKRPVDFMRAVLEHGDPRFVVVLVGGGELAEEVAAMAALAPERFRILPFQNQSRMPITYRLGDLFVLPSAWGETWGLAVNEALASGRPVLVSDRVGCAIDVVQSPFGCVFPWRDWRAMTESAAALCFGPTSPAELRVAARRQSWNFDSSRTVAALYAGIERGLCP